MLEPPRQHQCGCCRSAAGYLWRSAAVFVAQPHQISVDVGLLQAFQRPARPPAGRDHMETRSVPPVEVGDGAVQALVGTVGQGRELGDPRGMGGMLRYTPAATRSERASTATARITDRRAGPGRGAAVDSLSPSISAPCGNGPRVGTRISTTPHCRWWRLASWRHHLDQYSSHEERDCHHQGLRAWSCDPRRQHHRSDPSQRPSTDRRPMKC